MSTSAHWLEARTAIEGAFSTAWAAATVVLFENTKTEPPKSTAYVTLTILTGGEAEYASLGNPPRRRYRGVVIVRCFVPGGTGSAAVEGLVGNAEEVFFNPATGVGREISSGAHGQIVFDEPPSREPAGPTNGFYAVIVSAPFYRDQQGA